MKIITFIAVPFLVFGQEFQISTEPGFMPLKVDPFTKIIYYRHWINYQTMSINADGTNEIISFFPTVPSFAHLEHKAAYIATQTGNDSLFLYDFNKDTSQYLFKYDIDIGSIIFSPNDEKLIFSNASFIFNYYSFEDSLLHDLGLRVYSQIPEWMDDSTIICMSSRGYGDSYIINLSTRNNSSDTLLSAQDTVTFTGFSYNSELNILAYAWRYYGKIGTNVGINLLKLSDSSDSTIFDYKRDDPIGTYIDLQYLTWSPNNDKLGFLGRDPTNPFTQVYVYNSITNKVKRFTTLYEYDEEGKKYDLTWLNQDTLLYVSFKYEQAPQIFGFDILSPLSIENYAVKLHDDLAISNYPNPFNSYTSIKFTLPFNSSVTVNIFNIIGQKVKSIKFSSLTSGIQEIRWDGKNDNGLDVTSGVYIVQLKATSYENNKVLSKSTKVILIR